MTHDWKTITSHPAAEMFPMLSTERHAELVESIRANGLRVPITLCDGQVLDGRNRLRACLEAGVEPSGVEFDGGNPYEFVWSLNGQRRDLDPGQRAAIGIKIGKAAADWEERKQAKIDEGNAKRAEAAREQMDARKRDEVGRIQPGALSRDNAPGDRDDIEDGLYDSDEDDETDDDIEDTQATTHDAIEDAKPGPKPAPKYERSHEEIAKRTNVSPATAARAQSLSNKRPDLLDKVADGSMKLTEAMRQVKREEVAGKVEALPSGPTKYRVIYADPPWQYNDSRSGLDGYAATAAEDHYPTMKTADICALDVKALAADDSVLLCWATFPMLTDALAVVTAWGFKYKTALVWDKVRSNFGHYHGANAELLLIATRGSGVPDASHRVDQVQVLARVGKHSEKPEEFRALIDRLWTSGKRIELFRRGEAPAGWEIWGNEAATTAEEVA